MTNPVILLGTQSNGETLPVQVDATGRLVAEGLPGDQGPPGPPGPEGPEGPEGQLDLPPDPYEGALLGWLNGGLAWVGAPPVPIPENVFGPITNWDPGGVLTVEGPIPSGVGNGVYLTQVFQDGTPTRSDKPWNVEEAWGSPTGGFVVGHLDEPGYESTQAFTGDVGQTSNIWYSTSGQWSSFSSGGFFDSATTVDIWIHLNKAGKLKVNDTEIDLGPYTDGAFNKITVNTSGVGFNNVSFLHPVGLHGVVVNGVQLVDSSIGALQGRVNQVISETEILIAPTDDGSFSSGRYLKMPTQRVAPWVLRGVGPTTDIDLLRPS
jgi:hypothetical protein